ncbi:MAG: protein-L-isoaspartate(D-aspartate) O-methyltransferase [Flavobacteriales bacterium]|jgi:protein-L-isoaspartate(D-aspartate) O-methyltransferase|tara:strand:- start:2437 stop:3096 length:660 start_codon:yes stop_codon:yes gene_type:complete
MQLVDKAKHQGSRKRLVLELQEMGIESPQVLDALLKVPRHFFLDSSFEEHAYQNKAFPIGTDQTISHPYTVAFQTEVLTLKKGDKVLEIGTGSGYQTAVLFHLGAQVFSIERQHLLFDKTKQLLATMKIKAFLHYGDGYEGLPEKAPFDKIIVTAGAPSLPEKLFAQLAIGGMMIIPIGKGSQIMTLIIKTATSTYKKVEFDNFNETNFRFVPMLKSKQ